MLFYLNKKDVEELDNLRRDYRKKRLGWDSESEPAIRARNEYTRQREALFKKVQDRHFNELGNNLKAVLKDAKEQADDIIERYADFYKAENEMRAILTTELERHRKLLQQDAELLTELDEWIDADAKLCY